MGSLILRLLGFLGLLWALSIGLCHCQEQSVVISSFTRPVTWLKPYDWTYFRGNNLLLLFPIIWLFCGAISCGFGCHLHFFVRYWRARGRKIQFFLVAFVEFTLILVGYINIDRNYWDDWYYRIAVDIGWLGTVFFPDSNLIVVLVSRRLRDVLWIILGRFLFNRWVYFQSASHILTAINKVSYMVRYCWSCNYLIFRGPGRSIDVYWGDCES